jgi:hypothetical protein
VLASIDSASHWIILAKDIERFRRDLPILPLNENVVSRTFVFWIGSSKRTFVPDNTLEVPESQSKQIVCVQVARRVHVRVH